VSAFRKFETQVLRLLVVPKLNEQVVSSIEQKRRIRELRVFGVDKIVAKGAGA
jgi:hypothetical protein